jgi:outer membrane receptor protein involved in Fe transport
VTGERDAFARVDLHAAQAMPGGLDVTFGVDNLFDAQPAQWADAVDRRVYTGVSWTFNRTLHPD